MRRVLLLLLLIAVPASSYAQSEPDWRDRPADRERDRDRDRDRDRGRRRERDRHRDDLFNRNAVELTPVAGYRWGGTLYAEDSRLFRFDVDVASNPAYGAILGIPIGRSGMKLELMANRQQSHLQPAESLFDPDANVGDLDVSYYHAGVQVPLSDSRSVIPFVTVGAGIARLEPKFVGAAAENRFSAAAGFGVKLPITRNFGFRFEARGYFTDTANDEDDCSRCRDANRDFYQGETNAGLVFSF